MKIKAFFKTTIYSYLYFLFFQLILLLIVAYIINGLYIKIDLMFTEDLYKNMTITKEELVFLQRTLLNKSYNELSPFISLTIIVLYLFYIICKKLANLNLVYPKTLDKVIEFKYAMQQLNIKTADEQIDFISRSLLTVYRTNNPLKETTQTNCKASIYTFFGNPIYRDVIIIKSLMIDNKLCLKYEDFEQISKEIENTMSKFNQAKLTTLKQKITELETDIDNKNEELTEIKNTLKKERKEHTDFKNETILNQTLFHVACCMKKEVEENTLYSREDIHNRFKQEFEWIEQNMPSVQMNLLKEQINRNKSTDKGVFNLKESSMQYVRELLKPYIQTVGGAPKKKAE